MLYGVTYRTQFFTHSEKGTMISCRLNGCFSRLQEESPFSGSLILRDNRYDYRVIHAMEVSPAENGV